MVVIGNRKLSVQDFEQVLFDQTAVTLDPDAAQAVKKNYEFSKRLRER